MLGRAGSVIAVISGMLFVDKPAGLTSHDVVARARRALGTRKVGHAGTLDPAATGLLTLGVGPATRLLTYLVGLDKQYTTTIRLGYATTTDDAEGEALSEPASAAALAAATDGRIAAEVAALTGDIDQVPSAVSAIKVEGRRAYDRVRAGEEVALASRRVTVSRFDVLAIRRATGKLELDAVVDCSSGTYIRALARDLGTSLGIGGHLTALRRTRVGPFTVDDAATITVDALITAGENASAASLLASPADVAARLFAVLPVDADQVRDLSHGKRLSGLDLADASPVGAVDSAGRLVALLSVQAGEGRILTGFPQDA
jgi:tRNA pseudouridine55 synthase